MDWERATFEGTERAQAAAVAALTPGERMDLLTELLDLAEASGALQAAIEERHREIVDRWNGVSVRS